MTKIFSDRGNNRNMAKVITVDKDTYIGYNFLIKQFFVVNKNTTTYRDTSTEIKKVLDIVAPDNVVSVNFLDEYANQLETLDHLYYTLYDTGSHISTIQFNSYDEYPLTLDAEKQKLYIMNTNIIFDLTLNEARASRINIIQSYYKEHLGLSLTSTELTAVYNTLINTYIPHVYNVVDDTTDITTSPVYFSNTFAVSNFTNKGKSTYQAELNPNQLYNFPTIAYIVNANSSTNAITLSSTVPNTLFTGSTIVVENATTVLDTYTYSADGTYTIASIDTDTNIIYTKEALSGSYTYNYPILYSISTSVSITDIDRYTSTVTLAEPTPDTIQTGDIVYIEGTQQSVEGETVTADGEYIVGNVQENSITLQSLPNASYTYTEGTYPTLTKRIPIGNIQSIASPSIDTPNIYTITLTSTPEQTLTVNSKVVISYNNSYTYYSINSIEENVITCTYMSGTLTEYTVNYPLLQVPEPYEEILVSVTSSTNEKILPVGEFMVDNFNQCKEYLGLLEGNTLPTDSVYANIGAEVGKSIEVEGLEFPIEFKGFFSVVYPDKEN